MHYSSLMAIRRASQGDPSGDPFWSPFEPSRPILEPFGQGLWASRAIQAHRCTWIFHGIPCETVQNRSEPVN